MKKFDLEKFREAIKQADANIKFEETESDKKIKNTTQPVKILKRGNNYDRRPLE